MPRLFSWQPSQFTTELVSPLCSCLCYAVPGLRQHDVKTSIFKCSVHPLAPHSRDQTPWLLFYFITQFYVASIRERLLIESGVY